MVFLGEVFSIYFFSVLIFHDGCFLNWTLYLQYKFLLYTVKAWGWRVGGGGPNVVEKEKQHKNCLLKILKGLFAFTSSNVPVIS